MSNGFSAALRRLMAGLALAALSLAATSAGAANVVLNGAPSYSYDLDTGLATFTNLRVDNLSFDGGTVTVRVELWAFAYTYLGTPQPGYRLALCVPADTIPPFSYIDEIRCKALPFTPPPDGTWQLALIATEYTGAPTNDGFAFRGYRSDTPPVVFGARRPSSALVAVEYYWAARDHYFITANPVEIAALDASPPGGWLRTGSSFPVYDKAPAGGNPIAGSSPVCRFYLPPAFGDSHYYSASPDECAAVRAKYPGFTYESPNVFYIPLPDTLTGVCPLGTTVVYRLWNQRADTNHRYTTDILLVQQTLARGFVLEGYGLTSAVMCAPSY
ncbi:MAG: hypothetical protein ABI886_01475 [Betaproteobacteria bacterium]